MTTKHEIEIPDLPEGWRAVEARIDPDQYNKYVGDDGCLYWNAKIKLEKIKPRRIVLENAGIGKPRIGDYIFCRGDFCMCSDPDNFGSNHQIWRVVEE